MKNQSEDKTRIEQEKRFLEWVKARDDDWWEDQARISIWDFRVMQGFFNNDIQQSIDTAVREERKKVINELITLRSGYVYDDYSSLYQQSGKIWTEWHETEDKFFMKELVSQELEQLKK